MASAETTVGTPKEGYSDATLPLIVTAKLTILGKELIDTLFGINLT